MVGKVIKIEDAETAKKLFDLLGEINPDDVEALPEDDDACCNEENNTLKEDFDEEFDDYQEGMFHGIISGFSIAHLIAQMSPEERLSIFHDDDLCSVLEKWEDNIPAFLHLLDEHVFDPYDIVVDRDGKKYAVVSDDPEMLKVEVVNREFQKTKISRFDLTLAAR